MIVNGDDPLLEQNEFDAGGGPMWKYKGSYFSGMVEDYVNGMLNCQTEVQNGRTEGVTRFYYDNGKIEHEYYLHNNGLHGLFREWDPDGTLISETNWMNGVMEGDCKHFHRNGQIAKEYSKINNLLHGVHKDWDANGNLISETIWDNGVKV